jgi:hypothetical protein
MDSGQRGAVGSTVLCLVEAERKPVTVSATVLLMAVAVREIRNKTKIRNATPNRAQVCRFISTTLTLLGYMLHLSVEHRNVIGQNGVT